MAETTVLGKMREFIASFPDYDILSQLTIDFTDHVPDCAGLFPSGLVELRRTTDIVGDISVTNQYNFALYTNLTKSPDEDTGATVNAEWLISFQEWVQEQSALHLAPTFGDEPNRERITAQNGAIYSTDDEGAAIYAIQISITFTNHLNW